MQHPKQSPDLLKIAVVAAGGSQRVASLCQISKWLVNKRIRESEWPGSEIKTLCEAGDNFVNAQQLIDFLAQAKQPNPSHQRADAAAEVSHGG